MFLETLILPVSHCTQPDLFFFFFSLRKRPWILIVVCSCNFFRSKYGTPTISILCSATGVVLLSWLSFQQIIEFLNFLYALGMLLEFAAFIRLRIKKPDLHRPYRIPLGTLGATIFCLPPALLIVLVMCLASARTFIVSGIIIILGFLLYPGIEYAKERRWAAFCSTPMSCGGYSDTIPVISLQEDQPVADEATQSLLLGIAQGSSNGVFKSA